MSKNYNNEILNDCSWFEWDNAQWVDFLTEEIVPHTPEEMTVYWQPLTSLKEQYEKKKEEV
jgi:hypothetical protein